MDNKPELHRNCNRRQPKSIAIFSQYPKCKTEWWCISLKKLRTVVQSNLISFGRVLNRSARKYIKCLNIPFSLWHSMRFFGSQPICRRCRFNFDLYAQCNVPGHNIQAPKFRLHSIGQSARKSSLHALSIFRGLTVIQPLKWLPKLMTCLSEKRSHTKNIDLLFIGYGHCTSHL